MLNKSERGPIFVPGAIVAASGVVIFVLALIFNTVTADDGGGANIGAGLLAFLGLFVATIGAILTAVSLIVGAAKVRTLEAFRVNSEKE